MIKKSGGFLHPKKAIEEFGIKKGMKIADFGCGAGYFSISMAEVVGEKGKIYALDVLKTALELVRSRAKIKSLLNVETIWSNLEVLGGSKIETEFLDMVLLVNILFQSPKKIDIMKEANRVVKKKGKIIIIEWQKNQLMGPPEKLVVSKSLIRELAKKQGLKFEKEFPAGKHHWGMIFIKS